MAINPVQFAKSNSSWFGIVLALVLSLAGWATNWGATKSDNAHLAAQVQRLDNESVKRQEMDDLKARLNRIEDKLDQLLSRGK